LATRNAQPGLAGVGGQHAVLATQQFVQDGQALDGIVDHQYRGLAPGDVHEAGWAAKGGGGLKADCTGLDIARYRPRAPDVE